MPQSDCACPLRMFMSLPRQDRDIPSDSFSIAHEVLAKFPNHGLYVQHISVFSRMSVYISWLHRLLVEFCKRLTRYRIMFFCPRFTRTGRMAEDMVDVTAPAAIPTCEHQIGVGFFSVCFSGPDRRTWQHRGLRHVDGRCLASAAARLEAGRRGTGSLPDQSERLMPVIVLASPKGGVGMTTTAVILGTEYAWADIDVRFADCDPNACLDLCARRTLFHPAAHFLKG